MKHETDYIFNHVYIHGVIDVAYKFRELGWVPYTYQKYKMADGTVHQFIVTEDEYIELPDLDAALAWVVSDIDMLQVFVDNGYIIKETKNA